MTVSRIKQICFRSILWPRESVYDSKFTQYKSLIKKVQNSGNY